MIATLVLTCQLMTADFTLLSGSGIRASRYPCSANFILKSGCIVRGEVFSTTKMNCILKKAGLPTIVPGVASKPVFDRLETHLASKRK